MLTKLEAVNQMLDLIGETPVSSVTSTPALPDADRAVRFLDRASKEVQSRGYQCNKITTDVTPDTSGYVPVGSTWLRVDTVWTGTELDVTVRNKDGLRYLFNLETNSFDFSACPTINIEYVEYLDYEDLTPTLQDYIAARAAVRFQQATVSSAELDKFAKEQEAIALFALNEAEAEAEDANMLTDNAHAAMITWRRNRFWGS